MTKLKLAHYAALLAFAIGLVAARSGVAADRRPLTDWSGDWRAGDDLNIVIFLENGEELAIDGFATYGAQDADRVAQGSVQVGRFFARVTEDWVEEGNRIRFAVEDDEVLPFDTAIPGMCRIELQLVWPTLKAHDNGRCGGANVSFTGEYSNPDKK